MKKIHYVHMGFEFTGTTWLFENFKRHEGIDYKNIKEFGVYKFDKDDDVYFREYENCDVSFNLNPNDCDLPDEIISHRSKYITHCGVSIRNPYERLEGWINFSKNRVLTETPAQWLNSRLNEGFTDYITKIKRWESLCDKPMHYMVFDDLLDDDQAYFDSLMDFLGLEKGMEVLHQKYNWRPRNIKLEFNDEHKAKINEHIDQMSAFLARELSHWKR